MIKRILWRKYDMSYGAFEIPKWWGVAYKSPVSLHVILCPIPLNYIVGLLVKIGYALKRGPAPSKKMSAIAKANEQQITIEHQLRTIQLFRQALLLRDINPDHILGKEVEKDA